MKEIEFQKLFYRYFLSKVDETNFCLTFTFINMKNQADTYKLIHPLGNQRNRKFGSVFLAIDEKSNEQVIVKKVQKTTGNLVALNQLISEKQFSFEKDGLPKVLDFFETENELVLVKNYQLGVPLDAFWFKLKRKNKLAFLDLFFEQLNPILDYLHDQSIFHCDLKPSNILISENNGTIKVELIDFGLAIKQPIQLERKILFPLGYAAPELLLNQLQLVNRTSDYFSIGILLYRLFCGELPLKHPNPSVYTNLQLTYPIPKHDDLPIGMYEIIANCTIKPKFEQLPSKTSQKDLERILTEAQKKRIQSTQEILEALQKVKFKKRFGFF